MCALENTVEQVFLLSQPSRNRRGYLGFMWKPNATKRGFFAVPHAAHLGKHWEKKYFCEARFHEIVGVTLKFVRKPNTRKCGFFSRTSYRLPRVHQKAENHSLVLNFSQSPKMCIWKIQQKQVFFLNQLSRKSLGLPSFHRRAEHYKTWGSRSPSRCSPWKTPGKEFCKTGFHNIVGVSLGFIIKPNTTKCVFLAIPEDALFGNTARTRISKPAFTKIVCGLHSRVHQKTQR